MASHTLRSIEHVVEVIDVRGPDANAAPDLLLEVPHGATRAAHYEELRAQLVSQLPDDLRDFFFVNTDVGAPELAIAIAERFVGGSTRRRALVVRSLVPRTFVDCNRVIDATTEPHASAAGEITPGLHVYVRDAADRRLLLDRYAAYVAVARAAYDAVCGHGGTALMVHSYAPRSLDIPVDDRVVERLRLEYRPGRIETWPLRTPIDLIADDPDGRRLGGTELVDACRSTLEVAGFTVGLCATYTLHPGTMAHRFAHDYPDRTLCIEVRRDLLVDEFTPFAEMSANAARVAPLATALSAAVAVVASSRPKR